MQDQDEPEKKKKKKKKAERSTKSATKAKSSKGQKRAVGEEVKPNLKLLLTAISTKCVAEDDNGVLSVSEPKKARAAFKALGGDEWADEMMDQLEKVLGEYTSPKKIQAVVFPF